MKNPWVTVTLWVLGPPAAGVLVILLGDLGSLGWPPAPSEWAGWLDTEDPAVVIAMVLRAGMVAGCAVMTLRVTTAVGCLALDPRRHRCRGSSGVSGSLTAALSRLARPAALAGLGAGLVSTAIAAHADAASRGPAQSHATSFATSPADTGTPPDADRDAGATEPEPASARMRRLRLELAPFAKPEGQRDRADEWVVERGDHLWSIAAETVAEHLGATPSERDIARYWLRLIEANGDRFVLPGDPDLIMPGQRLALPDPSLSDRVRRSDRGR